MMPASAWFQRMSQRERMLALSVAAVIFVLVNLFAWSALLGGISRARADFKDRKAKHAAQVLYGKERDLWTKREEWMKKHQPVLKSAGEASTLLDGIKQIAAKHKILIENPAIGTSDSTPTHQAVFASIETKSPWPPLVHFLYDVQQPEKFIVFENVTLAIDSSDATVMRGKFKISRWFAPTPKTK
jgi:hypothetical protein